jgi:hypothetical protein
MDRSRLQVSGKEQMAQKTATVVSREFPVLRAVGLYLLAQVD